MEAYKRGCYFDGWEECFQYDTWMQTFADMGIDPAFYCQRAIGLDEVTPWSHMDYGVTHEYLVREYNKALAAQTTQSCNRACHGCGANHLPVWHTLGFNPHIYMTFACPLSLGQESECECVDVKTEAEAPDFAQWKTALNAIMPAGIVITRVAPVQMKADRIAWACYQITYPAEAAAVLDQYNALESAPVEKHGKKGNKIIELKQHIPQVAYTAEGDAVRIELCLPASQELNLNPSLLTGFLEEKFGLPAASANILRTKFLTADRQLFA